VTHRQWQAFIDDGGYADGRWWTPLNRPEPVTPAWNEPTAPRERVNWFEALAYCRWLSHRLEREITLPTEQQWERAARGIEGREWPWNGDWDAEKANAERRIGRTSLVGLFPHGATPPEREGEMGILDLAGNVWEWCLNEYDDPLRTGTDGLANRALRGGSWYDASRDGRASFRFSTTPTMQAGELGLRLLARCPPFNPRI